MPTSLDIELLPVYRRAGQDSAAIPGLSIAQRPRRSARSREADHLIIYLAFAGSSGYSIEQLDQLLSGLSKAYYETSGSVTAALRSAIEEINQTFLRRNLQLSGSGQQTVGLLTLITMRGEQMFLAQSGPVYALFLSSASPQELYDPQLSGRGLGISQTASIRYFHASLNPEDLILLAAQPGSQWDYDRLTIMRGQPVEIQLSTLLGKSSDVNAVLAFARSGSGRVAMLEGRLTRQTAERPLAIEAIAAEEAIQLPGPTSSVQENFMAPAEGAEDRVQQQAFMDDYKPLPELDSTAPVEAPLRSEAVSFSPQEKKAAVIQTAAIEAETTTSGEQSARRGASRTGGFRRFISLLAAGLNRIIPEQAIASIPNSVMAFTALAIPLVVVAMATAVYFRRGLAAQSDISYTRAQQAFQQAETISEPLSRREALVAALTYLDAADSYRVSTNTQELHSQIQTALDELDLVKRLDYQTAIIGGLPEGIVINRLAVLDTDLYLLDSNSGRILRAFYTNQGYQIDPTFECGPGGIANLGPLMDMSLWPVGSAPTASVVGLDADGTLLFCSPEGPPLARELANPAERELQDITGFALDFNDLYLLHPAANAVWVYWNGDFDGMPAYYFSDQPPTLVDAIDLVANDEEVYLLHSDGRTTLCITGSLGDVTPNRCTDPAPYLDTRLGRENAAYLSSEPYSQLQYSPPPDPSMYYLAPSSQSVDRFSLRNLTYQTRYAPRQILPGETATAFTVDPVARQIFLAVGNDIYYANLP